MPDLNVNVFRINRTSLKDPLMQFLCFFLSQKKRLQDTCGGKMSAALKDYFSEKLEEEPWSDIEATLCFVVQRIPLFKEKRMMLKLKNICDERTNGKFEFKVFLTKRPEVYPSWDDQESDDEEVPADVFFGMKVDVKVESIDSLKKSCGVLVAAADSAVA